MTVILRVTRALGALLVIIVIVAGGASALARFGRLDALTSVHWGAVWTTVDDGTFVLGVITLVGWVAWGLATLSLVSELLALLTRERWRVRVPGLGLFAPASAVLVTAIVGLVAGQSIAPAAAHAAASAESPTVAAAAIARNDWEPRSEEQTRPAAELTTHVVRPGDDLWSLAEQYYQDGSRWRDIAVANQTVLVDSTDLLAPGMVLAIPDVPPRMVVAGLVESGVVVQSGDTLSSIAAELLGDASRWPELARANAGLVAHPDEIDVGWLLTVPGTDQPTVAGPMMQSDAGRTAQPSALELEAAQPEAAQAPAMNLEAAKAQADRPQAVPHPSAPSQPPAVPLTGGLGSCPIPAEPPADASSNADESAAWRAALPSSFGALLAAGLAGAYSVRRRQQSARRPLGRRLPELPEAASGSSAAMAAARDACASPVAETSTPTRVPLGEGDRGTAWCDLERNSVTWLQAGDGDDVAMATALALTLACAPEQAAITIVAAGASFGWLTSLDEPRLILVEQVDDALRLLDDTVAARAAGLPEEMSLEQLRADPALAEAWCPVVVLLAGPPGRALPASLSLLGISVVICGGTAPSTMPAATVHIRGDQAEILPHGEVFEPHLVSAPARRVLTEIFETANRTDYPAAPWWDDTPDTELPTVLRVAAWPGSVEDLPVVSTIESDHPVVRLLGPVELVGAHGETPTRAVKQCEEYCAWLLEHPGASPVTMAQELLVAEATRRSNMSRLRGWLGRDQVGAAYLPDAYSGRISLHPSVTSDWEQLQLCVSGGVNRAGDAALIEALGLLRGAPLADAAPGQWHWAEQLRADIAATVTDIAVVLGRRALNTGNLDLAQWAVDRALVAAPDGELLMGVQIQIAHALGDNARVDRLVLQLARQARMLGVDLADQTVTLLQEVVEGRARLRRA